jgi:hypothetical protein
MHSGMQSLLLQLIHVPFYTRLHYVAIFRDPPTQHNGSHRYTHTHIYAHHHQTLVTIASALNEILPGTSQLQVQSITSVLAWRVCKQLTVHTSHMYIDSSIWRS